ATVSRQASLADLSRLLERVVEASENYEANQTGSTTIGQRSTFASTGQSFGKLNQRAVLVPVVGARGGAGKSSLSSALAYLAAEAHIDTALVDFDLQFGDLSFLFGSTGQQNMSQRAEHHAGQSGTNLQPVDDLHAFLEEVSQGQGSLGVAESLRRFGKQLTPRLRLYAPRAVPEKTEAMAQFLPTVLDRLRCEHELIFINTGSYWTLLHSELLEQSDLAICVLDQSIVGVRATTELRELCRRLGVPVSRLLFVMNRVKGRSLQAQDVAEVLGAEKIFAVHDAGPSLVDLFDSGDFAQLTNQATFMSELFEVLNEIAIRSDLCIHDAISLRYAMRREGGTRLTSSVRTLGARTRNGHTVSHSSGNRRRGLLRRA
ncbi:MAG: hypothetical protein FWC86_05985, partial [Coriobacteriia bacterium]|nr:hypothetical protein [Coriobacteriia bacterium]